MPMRVAVVGAGVTGSACTWRLLTGKSKGMGEMAVSVFEMGRGAGGRSGTRHVREFPGLHVNHGAPLFHVPAADAEIEPLLSALIAAGRLKEWNDTYGSVNAETGVTGTGGASRGELEVGSQSFTRYNGVPAMSSVAGGCLQLAKDGGAAVNTHFSVRIKEFVPQRRDGVIVGWEVFGSDGQSFGLFDWIVVSGVTPALARWRAGFKVEPPVYAAAQASGSRLFPNLLAKLDKPLVYEQTHVVSVAWNVSSDGDIATRVKQCLAQLPFSIIQVQHHASLSKIYVQSMGPDYAVVVLHSTDDFARKHINVKGAASFVSVSNNVEGTTDGEDLVANELFDAFKQILGHFSASSLPHPVYGPAVHRWGAAFPKPELGSLGTEKAWVLPDERFVLAGDFLAPPNACVASALRSGLAAGDALLRIAQGLQVERPKVDIQSAL